MPIDPTLLTKAAKVYEAAESVEGEKPKEVYESHKQCAPGEFGMNKEGGMFARFVKKTAADGQYTGYAEKVPQNYLDTFDEYKDLHGPESGLDGTPAGRDYEQFQFANPMGIGGHGATDIRVSRMRRGDEKAYRYSGGYSAPLGASSAETPTLQYRDSRPAKPMPPRGVGPRPALTPKPAPAVPAVKASSDWKGFDYSKVGPGGLIGSRTLPKADATAKNWQGTQGTPRKPGSATAPADQKNPPMKPVPPTVKKSAFVFGQLVAQIRN
jgi:pyruvate/2-oxoglutarate dehydrogenase complex dihydrolipoamide acyltransferase (E2) component